MLVRENYLARIRGFYNSDLIKILVGIRRCGKSVILNQIVDELKEKNKVDDEHIIFINFEFKMPRVPKGFIRLHTIMNALFNTANPFLSIPHTGTDPT